MRALIAVLVAATLVSAAPAAAQPAKRCDGSFTVEVRDERLRIQAIDVRAVGCRSAKRTVRRFLDKVDSSARCYRASRRPPPTRGCSVGAWRCFRRATTKYCARPQPSADVSWRERPASQGR
jgi:hypothetical protein